MSNAFMLLGLPPIAALDLDALQQAWLQASRSSHPDQPGGNASLSAEINEAYEILQAPEKRLKHLLELHQAPWRTIPIDDSMMTLFSQIGQLLQKVSTFLKRKQTASSAIAKAILVPEEFRLREELESLSETIDAERTAIIDSLPSLDAKLNSGNIAILQDLQVLQARLAYLGRWQAQMREALLAFM